MSPVPATAGLLDINATLLAELIVFVIMVGVLARWAYPPIMRAAEARQRQIEEGVRAAAEAQKRLESVRVEVESTIAEARAQAREVIARAQKEAVAEVEEVRSRARSEAQAQVEKARDEIQVERDRAIQELQAQMSGLVVDAAGRVLRHAIDEKAHRQLIEESLAEVATRG